MTLPFGGLLSTLLMLLSCGAINTHLKENPFHISVLLYPFSSGVDHYIIMSNNERDRPCGKLHFRDGDNLT